MKLLKILLIFLFASAATIVATAQTNAPVVSTLPDKIATAEFARIITEFSESDGYFLSDNLISNETAYLPVLNKLQELNATGGAYIGVGPEQNFSYIAKIRPRIAFIIDIRHMAVTQHLLYKALFHWSENRAQFLSRLLSRPLAKEKPLGANATMQELLQYFAATPADEKLYAATRTEIRRIIETDLQIKLSLSDQKELEYVLKNFQVDGLETSFRLSGNWMYFPSFKDVLSQTDPRGQAQHFLASTADYDYLRQLQLKNLIIPINGDFGGKKSLAAIGAYLQKNNVTVTAFYLSNVEQYLFGDDSFDAFVSNVKKLPRTEQSLFIRSVLDRYDPPTNAGGHLFSMLLQRINVFVKDYDAGRYRDYYRLVNTNFIAPN